jgi:chromosome segregation ATPase
MRRTINTEKRVLRVNNRQTKYNEEAIVLLRDDLDAAIDQLDFINEALRETESLHSSALVTIRELELEASTLRRSTKRAEERLAERQQYLNAPPQSFSTGYPMHPDGLAFIMDASPER